jgi:hypothetical protein
VTARGIAGGRPQPQPPARDPACTAVYVANVSASAVVGSSNDCQEEEFMVMLSSYVRPKRLPALPEAVRPSEAA